MSRVIWVSGMSITRLRPACLKNHARPNFADLRVQSSVIFCYRDGAAGLEKKSQASPQSL